MKNLHNSWLIKDPIHAATATVSKHGQKGNKRQGAMLHTQPASGDGELVWPAGRRDTRCDKAWNDSLKLWNQCD